MATYTWRYILQFSPTQKYGGYSYTDVVLRPIANALATAIKPSTQVIYMLQGETGKSVSQYSKEWLDLVPQVRQWVAAGGRGVPTSNVKVGISLNYNKVFGWIDFDTIKPSEISKQFAANWAEQAGKYPLDLPNMRKLYQAIDIIGVSGESVVCCCFVCCCFGVFGGGVFVVCGFVCLVLVSPSHCTPPPQPKPHKHNHKHKPKPTRRSTSTSSTPTSRRRSSTTPKS